MPSTETAAALVAFLLFLGFALLSFLFFNEKVETPKVNYRLSSNIKPINYKIQLKPYLNESEPRKFTFDGECFIEIQASQNTNEIQLHIKNLNISLSEYYLRSDSTVRTGLPKVTPNNLTDIVVYNLNEELQAHVSYILHYVYVGSMDDDMSGFYRSNYTSSTNVTKWLASTKFQTIYARRVFPSFDEPKFKATFDLSLTRHNSFSSTGPTRRIAVNTSGDYTTDVYKTTPKMSTYLLAFIVSEFTNRSDNKFGVLARPEYYKLTKYSFDLGRKLLKAFDTYLGISYYKMGNTKMDMAAIPDFSAGAMENWGLLTFRERILLFDKQHSTLRSKQTVATVVAHEQAHMWFGNLVTCDWWSDTWLNEGFATYFGYFITHSVESDFDLPSQFVVEEIQYVMEKDATKDTNPLSDEDTNTPSDLSRMFNRISYSKGATFIRMTKYILGEDKFQESLKEYLRTHKYTNTIPSDLLTIWKKWWPAEYVQFAEIYFDSFTTQVGYPVVTFNRTNETTVQVSQKRFLLQDFDIADPSLIYAAPITLTTSTENNFTDTYPKFFLQEKSVTITISEHASWILGNIRAIGYYRVNYDMGTWRKIHEKLLSENRNDIHELNRAQIVDDILNLARAGKISYALAFKILEYLVNETKYLPWAAAFNGFIFLKNRLGEETTEFASYILGITNKAYSEVGFRQKKGDTPLDIYNRAQILAWSCKCGNTKCIAKAMSYFNKNLNKNPVPLNIRSVVYCTAMREGNEQDFEKLYKKYMTETVPTEKILVLSSLGCVKDSRLVKIFFHMIISNDVRRQDMNWALYSLYTENNENVERVFDLIDQNIEELASAIGGYSSVASVVSKITNGFTTKDQLRKLKAFIDNHKDKFGSSISKIQESIKTVEFNLKWSKGKLNAVKSFLANRK